ncbi:hypothetical protein [Bradyrhizobium sp. SEMIA]|uniref:hypothetical protein n=1 Tax=Bradyrhizobium sp. SEMIA TaxID=2597515 RepID=UPI0018A3D3DD|nr:hypothetical protein [Bradyrhizobium sp. SEMIA]QOG20415.1 hypothetical protein FOM02_26765 [Bradyrhizobium sp. SEMIA]
MSEELPLVGVIAKLELEPTDIVILKTREHLSHEVARRIVETFKNSLKIQNKIVVLDGGMELQVVSPAHVDPTREDLLKPIGNDGVVNAAICFNSLLLVADVHVTEEMVATWTQDQMDCAYDWAMRIHLHASDNDDAFVPDRPDFIPKSARLAVTDS